MPERPGSIPDTNLVALLIDVRTDIREARKETNEGFAMLHGKIDRMDESLKDHSHDDQHAILLVRGEIADVRDEHAKTAQTVAKIVGERTVEARAQEDAFFNGGTNGTGRHRLVSEHGAEFVIPTPPAGMPMSLRIGKSDSLKPPAVLRWIAKAFGGTAGKIVGGAIVTAAAGIGGAWFHAAVTPPETRLVQIPAQAPPVLSANPVVIVSAPVIAVSAPLPDAGASPPHARH
jgi:hypothetical protein